MKYANIWGAGPHKAPYAPEFNITIMKKIIKIILIIIGIILLIYGFVTENNTIACLSSVVALLVCLWDLWDDGIDGGTYDNWRRFSTGTHGNRRAVRFH